MSNPYDVAVLADSPVSYWPLDDPSGTTATDLADSNSGTYSGGFTLGGAGPSSYFGGSTAFNGSSGTVTIADATNLHLTAPLSVEAWFKGGTPGATYFPIYQKYTSSSPNPGIGLGIGVSSGSQASFWVGDVSGGWAQGVKQLGDNAWHHIVATLSGTTVTIYVDGVVDSVSTRTPSLTGTQSAFLASQFGTGSFLAGSLCAVAVYNAALTAGQVITHYKAGGFLVYGQSNFSNVPARKAISSSWLSRLLFAIVPGEESGNVVGARDYISRSLLPYQASAMTRAIGPWGPELNNTHTGSQGAKWGLGLQGSTQFTLSSLCLTDAYNDLSHLWGGENSSTADMRICQTGTNGVITFQLGADGAFTNLNAPSIPLNTYLMVTCRLAPGGVRSIWYGPYKVAERTDAGIAYGSGTETNGSGWGGSPQNSGRSWSGRLTCGYVWNRALSDYEIVTLAADPFAPVRPAPSRLSVLSVATQQPPATGSPFLLAHF